MSIIKTVIDQPIISKIVENAHVSTMENISTVENSGITTTSSYLINSNYSTQITQKSNQVSSVILYGISIVSLGIEGQERLCLAQISNTLLKQFSYNEIHNRRVALGITCVQCTPVQLEILRRAGAMPVSSRRCGMITRREAERLCRSFLGDNTPPRLPENFVFNVQHKCAWGCSGAFLPTRYNSSRAKCIKCHYCGIFFSPNKFIFHSHRMCSNDKYTQPDAANFNSWRRHMVLTGQPNLEVVYAWEDVKAMFNGGTRKRISNTMSTKNFNRNLHIFPSIPKRKLSNCTNINYIETANLTNSNLNCKSIKHNFSEIVDVTSTKLHTFGTNVNSKTCLTSSSIEQLNTPNNIEHNPISNLMNNTMNTASHFQLLPFNKNFMMDYMWQHSTKSSCIHHEEQYTGGRQQFQNFNGNSLVKVPWIKSTINSPNINKAYGDSSNNSEVSLQISNISAFKPINSHNQLPIKTITLSENRAYLALVNMSSPNQQINDIQPTTVIIPSTKATNDIFIDNIANSSSTITKMVWNNTLNFTMANNKEGFPNIGTQDNKRVKLHMKNENSNQFDQNRNYKLKKNIHILSDERKYLKYFNTIPNCDSYLDEDIIVDIETTEDENYPALLQCSQYNTTCNNKVKKLTDVPIYTNINTNDSNEKDEYIDVVHSDNSDSENHRQQFIN